MIYFCVSLFYEIIAAKFDPKTVSFIARPKKIHMEIDKPLPISAYQAFADRNLFKLPPSTKPSPKEEKKPVAVEALKQTKMKLKLWGTVTGDTDKAYAVIEDGIKKEQNLYRAGDTIQDATVKLVLREKVILHVQGKDEVLTIEKLESGGSGKGGRVSRPLPTKPGIARPPSVRRIRLNRSQLETALKSDLDISKQARVRPYFKDGKPNGIILTGVKPNSVYRRLGLRNGDILLGVDEADIQSAEDVSTIYQRINSASELTVKIKRRGRVITMNYTIE